MKNAILDNKFLGGLTADLQNKSMPWWCYKVQQTRKLLHTLLGCRVPLPSTSTACGIISGFSRLKFSIFSTRNPASRNPRNPGTYGDVCLTIDKSSWTTCIAQNMQNNPCTISRCINSKLCTLAAHVFSNLMDSGNNLVHLNMYFCQMKNLDGMIIKLHFKSSYYLLFP